MPATVAGICWPHGGTVGWITVTSPNIVGIFPELQGDDGRVCCSLVPAGKYRNGATRSWCQTHQHYWGVKADLAALAASGHVRCASHAAPMGYLLDPLVLDMGRYSRVTITEVPLGLSVVSQPHTGSPVRAQVPALAIACDATAPPLGPAAIVQVNITPPALRSLGAARNSGAHIGCINCARCGHPHLDLGSFAQAAHRRHYCGHCGHDATHGAQAAVSNPLHALADFYQGRLQFVHSNVHGDTML